MFRGYRLLGIAALTSALLIAFGLGAYWTGLPYPPERYQPYQDGESDKQGTSATIPDVSKPIVQRTPCNNPQSEGESDLCAQWRAAKAAEKSAEWTLYGVIASLIGIALFMWQLALTREAVKDTGDATIAMREANNIAKVSAERQLRAYLGVRDFTVTGLRSDETPALRFDIFNSGQTPAREVRYTAKIFGFTTDAHIAKIKFGKMEHPYSVGVSLPGQVGKAGGILHGIAFTEEQIEWFKSEKLYLVYAGILSYRDIFGKRHLLTFKKVLDGLSIQPDGTARIITCRVGNNSN